MPRSKVKEATKRPRSRWRAKARCAPPSSCRRGSVNRRACAHRRGAKPVVAVHYDPSQATALTLVRGLLSQHVMKALGDSLGGESAGGGMEVVRTAAASGARAVGVQPAVHDRSRRVDRSHRPALQRLRPLVRRHGRAVHPLHGHRGRRRRAAGAPARPVEAAARGAALAQPSSSAATSPAARSPRSSCSQSSTPPRSGSSTCASTAASPASSASAIAFALLTSSFGLLIAAIGRHPRRRAASPSSRRSSW